MRELFKHKLAYSFLMVGVLVMIGLYMAAWPDRFWQRVVAVAFATFYICWGMITHLRSDHITKHIIYEYLGIGLLGGTILLLLTF
jgi:hypothetical protein